MTFRVMGIVNVTPDSFSDGGLFMAADAAVEHALALVREGAAIVDIGGESTRPGATPVEDREELRRVLGVVEAVAAARSGSRIETVPTAHPGAQSSADAQISPDAQSSADAQISIGAQSSAGAQISIDTSKSSVARAALDAGAELVNDVTALRGDPAMAAVIAERGAHCCLMHMRGTPATMQADPRYGDVVEEVKRFLAERLEFATSRGIAQERVLLDPGIGFGKTLEHNLELLARLEELTELGAPLVVGTSRKGFLGQIAARAGAQEQPVGVSERLPGTIATCVMALERGASVFRVHDVAPVRAALATAGATLGARWTARSTTNVRG
ncbi:MAG: dihydropteroate synthase [Solirubrobacterales bacterium]|nr:dihydropteroate synthase [Solirubrobacterales bacterium]